MASLRFGAYTCANWQSREIPAHKLQWTKSGTRYKNYQRGANAWNVMVTRRTNPWNSCEKVSTPCMDDQQFTKDGFDIVGEFADVCAQIAFKCFYLARIGPPDI